SFPHPGGNLTGFAVYEPSVVGKWMEMLKEIASQTGRVALLGNPKTAIYYDYLLHAAEAAAPSLGVETIPSRVENDAANVESAVAYIAAMPNSSIVVLPDSTRRTSTAISSSRLLLAIACPRFTATGSSSRPVVSCPTGLWPLTSIVRQPP